MGTTKIEVARTAHEIMQVLVASGARQIVSEYTTDGKVCALRFVIEHQGGGMLPFSLPVRVEPLMEHLRNDRAQAERVAWRQLLRWVQAQLALIDVGMVKAEEVYFPYLLRPDGVTVYEHISESKFKLLEAGR